MSIFAFILGMGILGTVGTLAVRVAEGPTVVLSKIERMGIGMGIGGTIGMSAVFLLHEVFRIPFSLTGMGCVLILTIALLSAILYQKKWNVLTSNEEQSPDLLVLPPWIKGLLGALIAWSIVKFVMSAVTFLVLTPTYLDDSLDNWNLRGKVFYETQSLTLQLPGEDPATSPFGVSSYPPTIPLIKAWLAAINGSWAEGLVNAPHAVWYVCAILIVFFALRRRIGTSWALIGAYLLLSMPLYVMHGTNPYSDCFLSVHIVIAVSMLLHAWMSENKADTFSFARICLLSALLLPFAKNEGLIVYLPPILLIGAIMMVRWKQSAFATNREIIRLILQAVCIGALFVLPWLLFKWGNGLTFGNAKGIADLHIAYQPGVLLAVSINTLFEGNWLYLFPLLIACLILRPKIAGTILFPLTAFILITYVGQLLIYTFTPLSTEALRQTGYARGIIHIMPSLCLLTALLLSTIVRRKEQGNLID